MEDLVKRNLAKLMSRTLCVAMVAASGCSLRQYAASSVGDALAEGGEVYAADDDIDFVGAATPFGLKTIESLLETVPEHKGLLLAAARGFTQYAYVYVQLPAEDAEDRDVAYAYRQLERARRLYVRARNYGLRGLKVAPDDVALLYWTGVAWTAAISLSKDSPAEIAGLRDADALIQRAVALDVDFDRGTLHTFLIAYEMARPNAGAGAAKLARSHFDRAVALSRGHQAAPFVSLAESVSVPRRDRAEFERLLGRALAVDPDAEPQWRLANLVMQRRARQLLAHADELFPE
jgi:predicted anti-sigma-YlaC factor YlaD